jgi:hypothetical protein
MKDVAVLFARSDSIYYQIPGCDVYDINRNALTYTGNLPIVAHPPCRSWGKLSHFAKPRNGEKELAIWAIQQIRNVGGVLEHPESSKLWNLLNLPLGNKIDVFGGFTLSIDQFWFGHKAAKRTWLYIVGIGPAEIPPYKIKYEYPKYTVNSALRKGHPNRKPEISKAEREQTPTELANWLVNLARLTNKK